MGLWVCCGLVPRQLTTCLALHHPSPPSLCLFLHSLLPGLAHLHTNGIAYRNLKPENVLIDSGGRAKLSDMKYAKKLPYRDAQGRLHSKTFTICGIVDYLAPGTDLTAIP